MSDRIRVEESWAPNTGQMEAHHREKVEGHCPFWKTQGHVSYCDLTGITCHYGLTETEVPDLCPLREGPVIRTVCLES